MRFRSVPAYTVAALLAAMLAGACAPAGNASPQGTASPQSLASPSAGGISTASPRTSRASATTAASSQGDSQVTIVVERDRYAPGEPIQLRIVNGLDDAITTVDQQAFCGVLRLDRAIGRRWRSSATVHLGLHHRT